MFSSSWCSLCVCSAVRRGYHVVRKRKQARNVRVLAADDDVRGSSGSDGQAASAGCLGEVAATSM
ncbi:hypothetical protein GW17_00033277 [Ensete ventricosum]|nr:hypothetical protein GW17_00033277 [Ensete ventricosum]